MNFYKIANQDVVSSNREIVLIKDKQYLLLLDKSSGQYYFHGENGRAYLLQDHPEWFREDPTNTMLMMGGV
jgi:hypothetical protein